MQKTNKALKNQKPTHAEAFDLKKRILNIAKELPDNYIELVCLSDPELNTPKGRQRIKNVKGMRSTDIHITELLETISIQYAKFQSTIKA